MPHEPNTSRRDFLQGRFTTADPNNASAPKAAAARSEYGAPAITEGLGGGKEGYLVTVSRRAMACNFTIHLNQTAGTTAVEAALEALDTVEGLESQLSVYRESSEVTQINRRAGTGWQAELARDERPDQPADDRESPAVQGTDPKGIGLPVEPRLFELLCLAQQIARDTAGAFDITSGPLSQVWGFSRRQGRLPDPEALAIACQRVGYEQVILDPAARTIRFARPGIEIQLNGIGKGYALDRAAEILTAAGVTDFLLHGGQSSLLARGNNATSPKGGWQVGIRHPLRPQTRLGTILLRDQALGTSGSATQSFYAQGRRWGHILDPRLGQPAAGGVYTSTVLAPTAAEADALATGLYVLGPDGAAEYTSNHAEIGTLIVARGPRAGELLLCACNLTSETWRPAPTRASS